MRHTPSFLAAASFFASAFPAFAGPGDPIGAAVRVVSQVTAELDRAERNLATNDDVRQNEIIAVSSDGLGELVLADETKLALGPNARLTLDKFVYDPEQSGGSIVLNMAKGAFRFVTGTAAKPAYVIRTPAASITVRGTIFDVYVEESGAIWMLLHEGAVQVCNDRGQCRVLDDPCRLVRVDGGGEVGQPGNWSGLRRDGEVDFETAFPFVMAPPGFDPEPRFERTAIEAGTCGGGEPIRPRYQRAEPAKPKYVPRKAQKAEPRYVPKKVQPKYEPPPKKVVKAEPKYQPPPKKKVAAVETKKKYDPPKKKYKGKGDNAAKAAKAVGLAIGIGLAIAGAKAYKKKGGYNY